MKKCKNFKKDNLTLLGFEYLLKYYGIKTQLGPIFSTYCPLFKIKSTNKKRTIVDILK